MLNDSENAQVDLYYDHYKDTQEIIKNHRVKRDKYTFFLFCIIAVIAFISIDAPNCSKIVNELLSSQLGLSSISFQVFNAIFLFILLFVSLQYYQSCLYIERMYLYLHNVENALSEMSKMNIDRESKSYLNNYPKTTGLAYFFYTYIIPAIIILISFYKFYIEIKEANTVVIIDCLFIIATILCSFVYIADRILISKKISWKELREKLKSVFFKVFVMKAKNTFNRAFVIYSAVFFVLCLIICTFPVLFTQHGCVDFNETGQIGDTIGGIMGPFIAIIAAYLTFIAFWVQFKANEKHREDISVERFNNNFYNLLNIHEQITNNLEFTENNNKVHHGRELFYFAFEKVIEHDGNKKYKGMRNRLKETGIKSYELSYTPTYFDHYFRNLYRIIRYVDEAAVFSNDRNIDQKKYEYIAILRSTLSRYELVWLFYNCLSDYGRSDFKPLIEKYSLLKNIRTDLLVYETDIRMYEPTAFEHIS